MSRAYAPCMRIPVVGITAYAERAQFGAWDVPTAFVPLSYVRAVERAGGRPLLVPPSEEAVEETLDALGARALGRRRPRPGPLRRRAAPGDVRGQSSARPRRARAAQGRARARPARACHLPRLPGAER